MILCVYLCVRAVLLTGCIVKCVDIVVGGKVRDAREEDRIGLLEYNSDDDAEEECI